MKGLSTLNMPQLTASAIKAKDLVKTYCLVAESRPFFLKSENDFNAIDKISFDVKKGERVGIVGENGSGKTTLLKIIAGITKLTSGQLETNGRIVSIIDLEAGFHPDLTGKENILINGAIIGMVRAEVKARLNQIIEFADIGKFTHEPLRTYSSGMKLRLGFSIAVHSNFNTLILDEGVAFGDESFRLKIIAKLNQFYRQKKTLIIASHILEFLDLNCTKFIWLKGGKIKEAGGHEVLQKYVQENADTFSDKHYLEKTDRF